MPDSRRFLHPEAIKRISRLDLRARHIVEGFLSGMHRSPYFGQSIEFLQHREYVPGDDLRHVDWKVWAKQDRYVVKQYEEGDITDGHIDGLACFARPGLVLVETLTGPEIPTREVLRENRQDKGFVTGNGGFFTKHSFGVYGAASPPKPFADECPQAEIDALPKRAVAESYNGTAEIEAYTAVFWRDAGPGELMLPWAVLALAAGLTLWAAQRLARRWQVG